MLKRVYCVRAETSGLEATGRLDVLLWATLLMGE